MTLENELIHLTLDPSCGGRIVALRDKATGVDLLASSDGNGTEAGVRAHFAGLSFDAGAICNDDAGSNMTLSAVAPDGTLKLSKTYALRTGLRGYSVTETVENLGTQEREILWGQRASFSAPFVDAGCLVIAPVVSYFDPKEEPILRMRWPKLVDGTDLSSARCMQPGESRTVYLADFGEGICRIASPLKGIAVELRWDAQQFPYCWLDECPGEMSLAPSTGLPNALEEGHGTLTLPSGGKAEAKLVVAIAGK